MNGTVSLFIFRISCIYYIIIYILKYLFRHENTPVQKVEVDPHFNFHFANGFEEADGTIVFGV